jgi:hypothetical protein
MSAEENKVIVRRFGQVWGKGSMAAVGELADGNLSVYYPFLGEPIRGPTYIQDRTAKISTRVVSSRDTVPGIHVIRISPLGRISRAPAKKRGGEIPEAATDRAVNGS